MQKNIRRMLSALLVLAMVLSVLPTVTLPVKVSAAETVAEKTAVFDYVDDISQYRQSTKTHTVNNDASLSWDTVYDDYPEKDGYVFAGWYTDIANMTPLATDVTAGSAYAKFVPEELMKTVAQVSTTTDYAKASSALRFVAAVESLDYAQVGFLLNREGSERTYTHAAKRVYTSLSAAVAGGSLTPAYFHSSAAYLYALTLSGIKDQSAGYTATPFWVTQDGTRVDHIPSAKKTVQMGVDANVAAGKTELPADTAWYNGSKDVFYIDNAAQLLAFAKLSKTVNFSGKTVKLDADIVYNESTIDEREWFVHDAENNAWSVADGVELWPGIGSENVPFAGVFDGQGHSIQGLAMLGTGKLGFFVQTSGATVKNVRVEKTTFRNLAASDAAKHCTGALIGFAENTTVSNIYSDAYLAYGNTIGMLGHVKGTTNISNCWFDGALNGAWGNVRAGGIVGFGNSAATTINMENCLFTGEGAATFNTSAYVGGLIGFANYGNKVNVTGCLSAGNLNAAAFKGTYVGSVIGNTPGAGGGTYTSVYATNECYVNSDSTAVLIGNGTTYTGTPVLVAEASIKGDAAKTVLAELDFAGAWIPMADALPQVGAVNTEIHTGWYDPTVNIYTINTLADLKGFVYLSANNSFEGKTVKLGADIIWNEGDASTWGTTPPANVWTPIGDGANGFTGVFDGQNHTISGLYIKTGGYAAFVARMYGANAAVENIRIVNSYFESDGTSDSYHNGAGIVGRASNGYTVSGVYTNAYFKGVKSMGIVAFSDVGVTNINNCWNDGTMDVSALTRMNTDPGVGGMVGFVANGQTHNITNCLVTATFTGALNDAEYLGGLFGMAAWNATVKATDCLVSADMSGLTGGVVGSVAGNNPGGNKSVYTDVYATTETHANLKGNGGATFPVIPVAEADILGDAAATTLSGLDFANFWAARENDVPQLGNKNCDISWYDANATEFVLYDAADLYGFSYLQETDSFAGKTVKLGADIVLNEGNAADWATTAPANVWNPIGKEDATRSFEGTFDGQGHTISGLYYDSALCGGGLFAYAGQAATIKNLNLRNSYIRSTHGAEWSATGSIAAFVNGTTVENIYSNAIIDANSGYVGGIAGRGQGIGSEFINCEFTGTITGTGNYANYYGGIQGSNSTNPTGATTFTNCTFSGAVTANLAVGGISGRSTGAAGSTAVATGCKVTGTVSAYNTTSASYAGGLFGLAEVSALTISNASVSGTVNPTLGIGGGLIGRVTNAPSVTIENSTFTGAVNGGTKLGGFIGQIQNGTAVNVAVTIKNSTYDGTVTATADITVNSKAEATVAGFVANVNKTGAGTVSLTILDSVAEGTLVAPAPYAAGAVAQIMNVAGITIHLERVTSTTDVQCASSNAGGLIGRIHGVNPSVTIQDCLAAATFTTDSFATAQVIAHAQGNAVKMENNFFVQTTNAAANGVESSGGAVTNAPVSVNQATFNYLVDCIASGMKPDYDGFVDSGYVINDAADLFGFGIYCQTNNCSGKTIKLGADIVVNNGSAADWSVNAPKYNWAPAGAFNTNISFAGTFNGQGHSISGLYCSYAGGNSLGLFREVSGTVTNFKLVNSYLENTASHQYGYNGVIAAYLNGGTISKVYTDAYINTVDSYAGGIVGFTGGATATVSECVFEGRLLARCTLQNGCDSTTDSARAHAKYVGGIVGAATATTNTINDCLSYGKIINECAQAHRTGGILGGAPNSGKTVTITGCLSLGDFATVNHTVNSYHFSMIMDCRGETENNAQVLTRPTNMDTLYTDNYIFAQKLYNATGAVINGNGYISGAQSGLGSTKRFTTVAGIVSNIKSRMADNTSALDFTNTWNFIEGELPILRWMDDTRVATPYYLTVDGEEIFCLQMSGETMDQYQDAKLVETVLEGQTNADGWQLYSLAYTYPAAVNFKDIDYNAGAYITKYINTDLADYNWYLDQMKGYGFKVVASNIINTDDAYYTALTNGGNTYSVTYFANTGETYVTVSNEMEFSPFMDEDYYVTADDNDPAKTTYDDITVTMVELRDGGLCQIIRLKNGHYIVIDGGTGATPAGTTVNGTTYTEAVRDRAELAAALGASVDSYVAGDTNNPQVIVDAWIFTHDHADHIGWLRGGIYGALQVDVYIKGFYYNFTDDFSVDAEFVIGDQTVQGYGNVAYAYQDSNGTNGSNRYYKGSLDNGPFWVEYSASHKLANNVNTPSWGTKGVPIYRLQAGQKFYFDGVTMEVPYTQDQVQPSEYKMDINASCAWLLFTDDHGNTYLEAGDTEIQNQDAVIELYDDYYDGGSGPNYALFGADLVNAFHHGLNIEIDGDNDHTRINTIFGIQNSNGNPATANTATNANDGRTKFIFYTRGYLNSIFGYVSDTTGWNSRNQRGNHYLTAYVYPGLITTSLNKAKAYPNLASPIAFSSYCTKADEKGYAWQGTTVVSFSANGISWNKQQTSSIYP